MGNVMSKHATPYEYLYDLSDISNVTITEHTKVEDDDCGILLWLFNSLESKVYNKLPYDVRSILLTYVMPSEQFTRNRVLWHY